MSRREAWLSAGLLFAIAVAVRAWAAGLVTFPIPEDATYYWGAARNLVHGQGLTSSAIWSYVTPARDASGALVLAFPRPAFEIWLPLASLLAAIPMALLGSGQYGASTAVPILVGGLVPVLAWRIAADVAEERQLPVGRARTLALGTGLVGAIWLPLVMSSAVLDSTAPFGVPALVACLLMVGLIRRPPERLLDPRLVGLGIAIGVAGLSRNEAMWIGLTWLIVAAAAWHARGVRLVAGAVAVAGVVAVAVMAPWLVRNWVTFGSPLPGQAALNAFSLSGYDIFAWHDPPTLARYLAAGPRVLIEQRVEAFGHNIVDVLLVPGFPVSIVGLAALPWIGRAQTLRPLAILALLTFAVTTLLFPVATTWGTFLHAALPAMVLLLVTAMVALDMLLAAVGRRRAWTRPTAWLGPAFAGATALLFTGLAIPAYGAQAAETGAAYAALGERFAAAGIPLDPAAPVIASHPMWMAEANGVRALALPDEPVASIVDLARRFGARYIVVDGQHGHWPGRVAGDPDARCLVPIELPPAPAAGMGATTSHAYVVFRIDCP